ncbi:MAG TPA: single-stranded DNA-binding protein [Firmicutes bacterium]|nr:single-stranded DNA-binding protein [Bacillota bacterium]
MLNRAILMGRLVADPELKQTPNGISVTSFRLAVERNYAPKDGGQRTADFIDIVAWRQTAEFVCRYFQKGQLVAVEGSIQTRAYEDKNGNKRTAVEVVADQVYFAESKKSSSPRTNEAVDFPPPFEEPAQKGTSFSIGNLEDFEEIDSDGDLPF